jgi:hypothetical protein
VRVIVVTVPPPDMESSDDIFRNPVLQQPCIDDEQVRGCESKVADPRCDVRAGSKAISRGG